MPASAPFRPHATALEDRTAPVAGELDPTFGTNGRLILTTAGEAVFNDIAIAPGDRIVAVGTVTNPGTDILVARFLPNGFLDTTFDGDGIKTFDVEGKVSFGNAVAVLPDSTILVGGRTEGANGTVDVALARVSADGATVTTRRRDLAGAGKNNEANAIAVNQTTGDIYLAGGVTGQTYAVYRYDSALNFLGEVTPAINLSMPAAYGLDVDTAGRVFVAGPGGGSSFAVTRLNPDLGGAVVKTFDWSKSVNFPVLGAIADRVVADPVTGAIYIGGSVLESATNGEIAVLRLDANLAELARTTLRFGPGSPYDRIATDAEGRVIVVGTTSTGGEIDSTGVPGVVRLLPTTLAPDPTFNNGAIRFFDFGGVDQTGAVAVDSRGAIVIAGTMNPNKSVATFGNRPELFRVLGDLPPESFPPPGSPPPPPLPPGVTPPPTGPAAVGGATDGSVRVLDPFGGLYNLGKTVTPFPGVSTDARVASADVNGDGTPDIVAGVGPGAPPRIVVVDGKSGNVIADFLTFESTFTRGVFVAAADMNDDGRAEVVVTPDQGGGPIVAVYSGSQLTAGAGADAQINRFFGIEDPNFRGGARATVGDVNADGTPDLVVSAGFQGGPRIAVFDGKPVIASNPNPQRLLGDFFAFENTVRNGAFVAAGDVDGDGFADIAFGGGPKGGPRVRVVSGAKLLAAPPFASLDDEGVGGVQLANMFVGDASLRGGVHPALRDVNGDGRADLIAGSGNNEPSRIRIFRSNVLLSGGPAEQEIDPFGGAVLANGVFVG